MADSTDVPSCLGNIAFWVSDFDAARRFYTELLGIPETASGDVPRKWVFYVGDGFSFSLNHAEFNPEQRGWTLCPMGGSVGDNFEPYVTVYVADLEAVIRRCRDAGIEIRTEEPFSLGENFGWSIEMRDPDGRTVAVTQR